MATNQGTQARIIPPGPSSAEAPPPSLRSLTAALRAIAAPAFLVRPDGALEQTNETGQRELQSRGPGLLRAIVDARDALAAGLRSPHLDDGSHLAVCELRQNEDPAYLLAVLRAPGFEGA